MSTSLVTSGRSGELALRAAIGDRWAKVGEAAEGLAELQKAGFGALVGRERVELVVAYGAEQDGVGVERDVEGGGGEGRAVLRDGDAADEAFDEGEVVAAEFGYGAEDVGGLLVTSGPMPSPARTAILSRM